MQIVTDRGADLAPEQWEGLNVNFAPLHITLDGKTYASGIDIQPEEFYQLLSKTENFPITSQPSPNDFADLYRRLAKTDPDILSVHISSGLSGTVNSAKAAISMVPEARVTLVDTKTLSAPEGWIVQAAGLALKQGWPLEKILPYLDRIRAVTEGVYTLNELRYLIHGGRISHIKGLMASLLNIKPIINVDLETGKYSQKGQDITIKRAVQRIIDFVAARFPENPTLRVQPLHGYFPEGVEILVEKMKSRFDCKFEVAIPIAPALGAHTGPSMVGMAVAPLSVFQELNNAAI